MFESLVECLLLCCKTVPDGVALAAARLLQDEWCRWPVTGLRRCRSRRDFVGRTFCFVSRRADAERVRLSPRASLYVLAVEGLYVVLAAVSPRCSSACAELLGGWSDDHYVEYVWVPNTFRRRDPHADKTHTKLVLSSFLLFLSLIHI